MTREALWQLSKSAASRWSARNAPRLGAALAYYSLLSMAPLLILIVAICGAVLSRTEAERNLLAKIQDLIGYSGAETIRTLIDNAHQGRGGLLATTIAIATVLFGASGVFVELRDSLNIIWDAPEPRSSTWRTLILQRLVSFAMVLALGLLLLLSLIASAALTVTENLFTSLLPGHAAILGVLANSLFSLISVAVLFGLIFKFVPDVPIDWRDVAIGAGVTAILFSIGKALLGFYLGTAAIGSAYGAAGSVVALVVWVYYSAQIFFFGAVFTRVYADRFGSHS